MTILNTTICAAAVAAIGLSAVACRRGPDAPAKAELPTLSVSHWTDRTELFMEHPPLVAGSTARMAVHVTTLADFRPLNEGRPSIEMRGSDGKVTTLQGSAPLRPGAFRVEGKIPAAGQYTWGVRVQAGSLNDFHDLGPITVFASEQAAWSAPAVPEGPPAIAYLKEQQWVTDFATVVVRPERVRASIRATATVVATAGGEAAVTAPSSGRLMATRLPAIGDNVSQGALLARFEPRLASLEDRSLLVQQIVEARAAVEAAEAEHRRAERLLAERAVPARRVEDATRALTVARGQLAAAEARLAQRDQVLRSGGAGVGEHAFELRAPITGTVVAVTATPGAAYEEGAELFRIVRTNPVVIEAHLPASSAVFRGQITGLAVEVPGRAEPFALRVLRQSSAATVDPRSRAVVLRFEVENPGRQLLIGQAGSVLLFTRETVDTPVVPPGALLHEAGRAYLFVQVEGEGFERRMVQLGARDGDRIAVVAGLKSGDRVVTRGAYDIQLASAAKGLPAEGHVH
jgi:RND family efflux transporter MFP subunit